MIFCALINYLMHSNDALVLFFPNQNWNQHNNYSYLLYLLFSLGIYNTFPKIKLSIYFWDCTSMYSKIKSITPENVVWVSEFSDNLLLYEVCNIM